MHGLRLRGIELAMAHALTGRHALYITRLHDRAVTHGISMLERAVEHIGHDLHVPVRVSWKPSAGGHAILVDHTQGAKSHVARIVVIPERKGMPRVQPTVLSVSAIQSFSDRNHH